MKDVKRAFLEAFRHTADCWEEHGYCCSGGNHVESVEYVGLDSEGRWLFTIKAWHEDGGIDGSLCHRVYERVGYGEALEIIAKYLAGDIASMAVAEAIEND